MGLTIAIASVLINALALFFLRHQTAMDHRRRRRQATLEYVVATSARSGEFAEIPPLKRELVGPYIENAPDGTKRGETIRLWLNIHEGLATAVNLGLYDRKLVMRLRGATIVRIWELFKPWILKTREDAAHASAYCEIELLANRIQTVATRQGRPIPIV